MKFNKETAIKVLDTIYDNTLEGLPGTPSIEEFVEDYTKKSSTKEKAVDSLIKWAKVKNATSGFVSSVGGIITLPITVPVGLTASFYIQMRMIAGIATISGYDPRSDQVKTFVYCCLIGDSITELMKEAGVKLTGKLSHQIISSISGQTLATINRRVGFRLVTKFGEKGVINLGKWIPFVSGVMGGTFDFFYCRTSGRVAKKIFFKSEQIK